MNTIKFTTSKPADAPQGPMCRIDAKPLSLGKTAAAGTGAVSSAFMGFLIWNINIILAGLGLGSVALGSWIAKYRIFFIATTLSLISYSFYKSYRSGCVLPRRNKIILWSTMAVSLSLTAYTIVKAYIL